MARFSAALTAQKVYGLRNNKMMFADPVPQNP
jgi:hypothetical protein